MSYNIFMRLDKFIRVKNIVMGMSSSFSIHQGDMYETISPNSFETIIHSSIACYWSNVGSYMNNSMNPSNPLKPSDPHSLIFHDDE